MEESSRNALISGGSRGIGKAIVECLARDGWNVSFTYLGSEEAAQSLVQSLQDEQCEVSAYQADVRDFQACARLVEKVKEEWNGPLDLLVNNAGIKRDEPLYRMEPETWNDVIDTNLTGTFNLTRSVIMDMIKRQSGCIVNVVSVSGILGLAGQVNYSASKAGVIGMTKALAREVARFHIRVNAVAPGFIETDMLRDIPEASRKRMFAQIASGSPGRPEDVSGVVRFLAGDSATYITGQVLPVDGGMV